MLFLQHFFFTFYLLCTVHPDLSTKSKHGQKVTSLINYTVAIGLDMSTGQVKIHRPILLDKNILV